MMLSGSNLFCYCFYGRNTTHNYLMFADHLFESNWMNLPVELQEYFPLMISHAQIPLTFHGYGLVNLNLQTFTSVRNNSFFNSFP